MPTKKRTNKNGRHWIRDAKRLAIYLRDGFACVYCGTTPEESIMTLDHIIPRIDGVDNDATNLITACLHCNSARQSREITEFVRTVAAYLNHGIDAHDILAYIERTRHRPLDLHAAKTIIACRGGFTAALHHTEDV